MENKCTKVNNTIRCECGGQIMIDAQLHPLVDLGFGFRKAKFVVDRKYGKQVIGYRGTCMKCRKDGNFMLPA